ncbi:hypothetical protein GF327_02105 [Candidatus Woesearchaeota archaeon]|nr:hypothetical protein [Candidatus Woesearchaeota archaeon]
MKKYKVIKCINCGKISVTFAEKVFRCTYCNKTCKFIKKRQIGLSVNILKSFDNPRQATEFCKIAKDKLKNKGKLANSGFYEN